MSPDQTGFRSIFTSHARVLLALLCLNGMQVADSLPKAVAESPLANAEARILADLTYLSSDELAGRGIGTEGIAKAAEFIARRYQELGLHTDAFTGTPYQNFTIAGPSKLGPIERNRLTIMSDSPSLSAKSLALGRDFNPLSLGGNGVFEGGLVFAGYGITAPKLEYDDFAALNVEGKIVVVVRKEPQQNDASSKFSGTRSSEFSFFTSKEQNAAEHKAAALIFVNDSMTLESANVKLRKEIEDKTAELELLKAQRPSNPADVKDLEKWSAQVQTVTAQLDAFRIRQQQGMDTLLGVTDAGTALSNKQLPTLFCSRSAIDPFIRAALGKSLAQLEAEIDSDLKPRSAELPQTSVRGEVEIESTQLPVRNVIGVLPGQGSLKAEYVVVGAHYDHVGMGGAGSLAPGTIEVHNGADDNGSGTVALLEIARRCSIPSSSDRRSIIFMAFTGEEWGLKGSQHYVRNPRWSLENTVAMINLDMVGRLSNNELTVYGTGTATQFSEQVDRLNELPKFQIVKESAGRGPSDHQSFYDAKIPVLHFFTGLHNDYHRPSDDIEKINIPGIARVSEMVANLVSELAIQPVRPELQLVAGTARPRSQTGRRPMLGVRLTYSENQQAIVEQVTPGGPADQAGVVSGDILVEIEGMAIRSPQDTRQILSGRKSGDEVTATILRNGERKEFRIKLANM